MPRKYIPVAPPVGDATASEVLDGATFSGENAGINVTGTMPNNGSGDITGPNDALSGSGYYSSITNSIPDRGSLTVDPQASSQSFAAGYYDTVDVNGDGNLTPSNVRDGVTVFGTTGSLSLGTDIQVNGTTEGSFTQTSDSTYNVSVETDHEVFGNPLTTTETFGSFDGGSNDRKTLAVHDDKSESSGANSTYVIHVSGTASPSGSNDLFGEETITVTRNTNDYASTTVGPITVGSESFTVVDKVSDTPLNTDSEWGIYTSFSNINFDLELNIDYRIGEYISVDQSNIVTGVSKN